MKAVQQTAPAAAQPAATETDPYAMPDTLAPASTDIPDTLDSTTGTAAATPAYAPIADSQQPYAAPQGTAANSSAPAELPVNNPYDMPYEQYGN